MLKWIPVVLMMSTPSTQDKDLREMPLYIVYRTFDTIEECKQTVLKEQNAMFFKAWQVYGFKITPSIIACVREDKLKNVMKESELLKDKSKWDQT